MAATDTPFSFIHLVINLVKNFEWEETSFWEYNSDNTCLPSSGGEQKLYF